MINEINACELSDEQLETVVGAGFKVSVDTQQSNWSKISQYSSGNSASAHASAYSEGDQHKSKFGSWDATASADANAGNIANVNQNNAIFSQNS
jgi:hypothetical protein